MTAIVTKNINYKYLRKKKAYLKFRLYFNSLYFISVAAALFVSLKYSFAWDKWWVNFLLISFFSVWLIYIIKAGLVSLIFGKEAYKTLK